MTKTQLIRACFHVLKAGGKVELRDGSIKLEMSKHFVTARVRCEPCYWASKVYRPTLAGLTTAFTNITMRQISGRNPLRHNPFVRRADYLTMCRIRRICTYSPKDRT